MKTAICLISLGALAFCGCTTPQKTTTLPPGTKIIFQTSEAANTFRADTMVDVNHISFVVLVTKPLKVVIEP